MHGGQTIHTFTSDGALHRDHVYQSTVCYAFIFPSQIVRFPTHWRSFFARKVDLHMTNRHWQCLGGGGVLIRI
jgi:hypothetical protein